MTQEGRMARGEANVKAGKFLDNSETLYFLENKPKEKSKPKKKGVEKVGEEEEKKEEDKEEGE